jgi:hypothetical protein
MAHLLLPFVPIGAARFLKTQYQTFESQSLSKTMSRGLKAGTKSWSVVLYSKSMSAEEIHNAETKLCEKRSHAEAQQRKKETPKHK